MLTKQNCAAVEAGSSALGTNRDTRRRHSCAGCRELGRGVRLLEQGRKGREADVRFTRLQRPECGRSGHAENSSSSLRFQRHVTHGFLILVPIHALRARSSLKASPHSKNQIPAHLRRLAVGGRDLGIASDGTEVPIQRHPSPNLFPSVRVRVASSVIV